MCSRHLGRCISEHCATASKSIVGILLKDMLGVAQMHGELSKSVRAQGFLALSKAGMAACALRTSRCICRRTPRLVKFTDLHSLQVGKNHDQYCMVMLMQKCQPGSALTPSISMLLVVGLEGSCCQVCMHARGASTYLQSVLTFHTGARSCRNTLIIPGVCVQASQHSYMSLRSFFLGRLFEVRWCGQWETMYM